MRYRNSSYAKNAFDNYFFEKNFFGDIIAVYDSTGKKLGSYTYDAWGNCTASYVSDATTAEKRVVSTLNPFRYRGYYYDTETGFYYLQSRYYDPARGRFLNADGYVSTGQGLIGYNMYAYCGNNPVMRIDERGQFWGAVIGVATIFVLTSFMSGSSPVPEPTPSIPNIEPYSSYGSGKGNVYIVTEDKLGEVESSKNNADVIIVDYRTNSDPNMKIMQSYKIKDKNYQKEIAQIMIDYNSEYPVTPAWNRSVNSLVDEWRFHNLAYSLHYKRERTADTDFNNNDEGKTLWDFVGR